MTRLENHLHKIRLGPCNAYLIQGEVGAVLVDAGHVNSGVCVILAYKDTYPELFRPLVGHVHSFNHRSNHVNGMIPK